MEGSELEKLVDDIQIGSRWRYDSGPVVREVVASQNNHGVGFQEPNLDLAGLGIEVPLRSDRGSNTSN